jgi:TPR repeat protein
VKLLFRFLLAAAAVSSLFAQQPPALPSGTAAATPAGATPAAAPNADADKVRQELQALAEKANGGDAAAAMELANRVLATGNADMASALYLKAAEANQVEAQEKLALLLLSSPNQALWPSGHSWLDKAILGGSVVAMEKQAVILLNGANGRERNVDEAVRLLNKARQLPGAKETFYLLGNLALQGVGMSRDGAIALAHFQEGAQRGSVPCMIALHRIYRDGSVIPKDLAKAEQLARQAIDLGDAEAAYEMAIFEENFRSTTPDWAAAARWLQIASDRGLGGATTRLTTYQLSGKLGKPNPVEAIRLCRLAANQGDAEACFQMSSFYREGKELPQDSVASAAWCRLAAERGLAVAQNEYGIMLVSGTGGLRNPQEAAQWFERAAQKQVPSALFNLAALYENGIGMPANSAEAFRLYQAAANSNHPGAQSRLAVLLQSGRVNGAPDPVGAAYWAERSARNDPAGAALAKQLSQSLTADQKGELQRRLKAAGIGPAGG